MKTKCQAVFGKQFPSILSVKGRDFKVTILKFFYKYFKFSFRDEEANASFMLGKRDVLLNNYQSACDHLSKACERM
jgi:hypothetical protein